MWRAYIYITAGKAAEGDQVLRGLEFRAEGYGLGPKESGTLLGTMSRTKSRAVLLGGKNSLALMHGTGFRGT